MLGRGRKIRVDAALLERRVSTALLFDMDDTLVATAAIWRDAEEHLLKSIGAVWTAELSATYKGKNALDVAATIHAALRPTQDLPTCQRIMRDRLIANFHAKAPLAVPGAVDLVRRLRHLGPSAVASGSPLPAIEHALASIGLGSAFNQLISSESVKRGKPSPDVFLAAAEKLGVRPADCVVFEDSLIGAQAAKAAGMRCIVRPSLANAKINDVSDRVVSDWAEVIDLTL